MGGSYRSNGSSILFATVAVATASTTAIMYRCFWYYKTKTDVCHGDNNRPSRITTVPSQQQQQQPTYNNSNSIRIQPPLRNVTPRPGEQSRIVYLTGIDKQTNEDELVELFSSGGPPIEIDASEISFRKGGGRAWALYRTAEDARRTIAALHGKTVHGCVLCARLEWGVEKDGKRITDKSTHTAILRGIQTRRGTPKKKQQVPVGNETNHPKTKKKSKKKQQQQSRTIEGKETAQAAATTSSEYFATYSHNSISIGEIEYPFPSGIYSTKLIQRLSMAVGSLPGNEDKDDVRQRHQREQDAKLLRLLSDVSILGCGSVHRYAKEVSEAFAMVDALERAIKHTFGVGTGDLQHPVICYCLGDGKYPIGAAALELFLQKPCSNSSNKNLWRFIAIDPLLSKRDGDSVVPEASTENNTGDSSTNATSMFHDRIELFSGLSQDYSIEKTDRDAASADGSDPRDPPLLSIAIACHSHAPLEEFWERMPSPKLCVALPCCAQFSELPKETPIFAYDNFEIYSPKRRINIFAST